MAPASDQIDALFISELALWPLDQGFKVHGYHMAAALASLGLRVKVASLAPPPVEPPDNLRAMMAPWPAPKDEHVKQFNAGWSGPLGVVRRGLARYLIDRPQRMAGVIPLVDRHRPRAVIGLGLHSPMMLAALRRVRPVPCVWYGADELINFHLSCLRRDPWRHWPARARALALHAALERSFVCGLDGAIGVSPRDTFLLRWMAGARRAVTIRNGVDLNAWPFDTPGAQPRQPNSLVFWGRMDFEPNIDAVCWFARRVWPRLKREQPDAVWRIAGKNPDARVIALSRLPGVEVLGEVEDVRPLAQQSSATILPMRCGGGIKNKLLEAAALGCAIVVSPAAVRGLTIDPDRRTWPLCRSPEQWVQAVRQLWSDPALGASIGRNARAWVEKHHDWTNAARALAGWLCSLPPRGLAGRAPRETTTAPSTLAVNTPLDQTPNPAGG
jgi:glycosyltransferase involved in cell wall biosynthesis